MTAQLTNAMYDNMKLRAERLAEDGYEIRFMSSHSKRCAFLACRCYDCNQPFDVNLPDDEEDRCCPRCESLNFSSRLSHD